MKYIGILLAAYLLGSIPFAKIIARLYGKDIQKEGSGNSGFANTWRVLGWKPAIPVLLLDVSKGYTAAMTASLLTHSTLWTMVAGFCAIIGHVFPVWLKFRGGKGVATGLGVLLCLNPYVGCSGFVIYLLALLHFKKSDLSSLSSMAILPVLCILISRPLVLYTLICAMFGFWTHRSNIKKYTLYDTRTSH